MSKNHKVKVYLLYIFAFIGIIVSVYLWYEYSQPTEITCQLSGCQTVRESDFSSFLGISVPVWGVVYYFGIILYAMSLMFDRKFGKYEKGLFLAVTTGGLIFSIYLTYLELFVIHAICQWCLVSAGAAVGIYFVSYTIFDPIKASKSLLSK